MNVITNIHLDTSRPTVRVYPAGLRRPFTAVSLGDHGEVQIMAFEPAQLTVLADALTDAARQLSQQLDIEAARQVNEQPVAVPA